MQAHQETIKKYGHNRRPSYGKAMPISSLLMDLTSSQHRNFESISKDGQSPRNDGQAVVFTFGQGTARYNNDVEQLSNLTNSFLNNEKITGIAHRIEYEEPKQPLFLKCTNYQHKNDNVEQANDENKSDIESVAQEPLNTAEANITGDDINTETEPLAQLRDSLCDESSKDPKEPSYSRSISQRHEFLTGMLHDAQEAIAVEPVQLKTSLNETEFHQYETEIKKNKPELNETEIKQTETDYHQPLIEEIEGHDVDNDFCKSEHEAQPFVTEPDTDDEVDVDVDIESKYRRRFDPIDMGSNDTEPSDTDPFELEPIITYPEEKLRIIEEGEDLIKFDDDDDDTGPDSELTIENLAKFDREYFRNKLAIAEALAQATMLTPSGASRRLAARKMEMNISDPDFVYDSVNGEYIPPKDLLLYLVR